MDEGANNKKGLAAAVCGASPLLLAAAVGGASSLFINVSEWSFPQ